MQYSLSSFEHTISACKSNNRISKIALLLNKIYRFRDSILHQDGCMQLHYYFNGNIDSQKYDIDKMCYKFNNTPQEQAEKFRVNWEFITNQYLKRNKTNLEIDVYYTCSYNGENIIDAFCGITDINLDKIVENYNQDWQTERIIWIGYHKNKDSQTCFFSKLPKDIIKYIWGFGINDNWYLDYCLR